MAWKHVVPRIENDRSRLSMEVLKIAVWRGLKGGCIATGIMTIYRLPVFHALPPTAEFWARYLGGNAERYTIPGILLHFFYGTIAGAVFGVIFTGLTGRLILAREWLGLVAGASYGMLLSLFGTEIIFPHILDEELELEHELVFHVGHLMYGLTLGT